MVKSGVVINQSFFQKFRKLRREVDEKGSATISELLDIGKTYARSYAPKFNGTVLRSIKTRLKNKQLSGTIYIEPQAEWGKFRLVEWMHKTGGIGKAHYLGSDGHWYTSKTGKEGKRIHSGNPKFMYSTRNYLNTIKTGIAKGRFKTINIK
jgi:hypothetical protein